MSKRLQADLRHQIAVIEHELRDEPMTATESLLLVLDNDRALYENCMSIAAAPPARDTAYPAIATAEAMREFIETLLDDINLTRVATIPGPLHEGAELLVRQLTQHALADVEFREVAEHYIGKVSEQR